MEVTCDIDDTRKPLTMEVISTLRFSGGAKRHPLQPVVKLAIKA